MLRNLLSWFHALLAISQSSLIKYAPIAETTGG